MITRINKWKKATIGDFFEVTNGKSNTDDAISDGMYPLFDRSVEIKKSNKYLFDKEALIVPGEGKEFVPRYFSGKFDLHQRAYAIFPKENSEIEIKYLYHWMRNFKEHLIKMAVGSTVKSLRLYMLKDFPIEYPGKDEQKKIVEILSNMDRAIEETEQVKNQMIVLNKGLMQNIFSTND